MTTHKEIIESKFNKLSDKIDNIYNSLIMFDEELILKMIEKTKESIEKNIELGFILIKNKKTNKITSIGDCIGSSYCITINKIEIKKDETMIGGFHTHREHKPLASVGDLRAAYTHGLECIGGVENDKISINCYKRKSEFKKNILNKLDKIREEEQSMFKEYEKTVNSKIIPSQTPQWIKDEYFKKYKNKTYNEIYKEMFIMAKNVHDKSDKFRDQYFNVIKII